MYIIFTLQSSSRLNHKTWMKGYVYFHISVFQEDVDPQSMFVRRWITISVQAVVLLSFYICGQLFESSVLLLTCLFRFLHVNIQKTWLDSSFFFHWFYSSFPPPLFLATYCVLMWMASYFFCPSPAATLSTTQCRQPRGKTGLCSEMFCSALLKVILKKKKPSQTDIDTQFQLTL